MTSKKSVLKITSERDPGSWDLSGGGCRVTHSSRGIHRAPFVLSSTHHCRCQNSSLLRISFVLSERNPNGYKPSLGVRNSAWPCQTSPDLLFTSTLIRIFTLLVLRRLCLRTETPETNDQVMLRSQTGARASWHWTLLLPTSPLALIRICSESWCCAASAPRSSCLRHMTWPSMCLATIRQCTHARVRERREFALKSVRRPPTCCFNAPDVHDARL